MFPPCRDAPHINNAAHALLPAILVSSTANIRNSDALDRAIVKKGHGMLAGQRGLAFIALSSLQEYVPPRPISPPLFGQISLGAIHSNPHDHAKIE